LLLFNKIVDDNKNNLFTLRTLILQHIEINILEANSGQEALTMLMTESVDLIILDIQMPEMDGFETASIIHSIQQTQHISIVFLTAAYKSDEFQTKGFSIQIGDGIVGQAAYEKKLFTINHLPKDYIKLQLCTPLNSLLILAQLLIENKKQNLSNKQLECA